MTPEPVAPELKVSGNPSYVAGYRAGVTAERNRVKGERDEYERIILAMSNEKYALFCELIREKGMLMQTLETSDREAVIDYLEEWESNMLSDLRNYDSEVKP